MIKIKKSDLPKWARNTPIYEGIEDDEIIDVPEEFLIYETEINDFKDYKKLLKSHAYFEINLSDNLIEFQENPENEDEILAYFVKNKDDSFIKEQLYEFRKIYAERHIEKEFEINISGIESHVFEGRDIQTECEFILKVGDFKFKVESKFFAKGRLENIIEILKEPEYPKKFLLINDMKLYSLKNNTVLCEYDKEPIFFQAYYEKDKIFKILKKTLKELEKIQGWVFSKKPFCFFYRRHNLSEFCLFDKNFSNYLNKTTNLSSFVSDYAEVLEKKLKIEPTVESLEKWLEDNDRIHYYD